MTYRLALLLLLTGTVAGCGGSKDKGEAATAEKPCSTAPPTALASGPKLAPGFPSPSSVTYTSEKKAGPSQIVMGYWKGDIQASYDGYKSSFAGTGYSITKNEKDMFDAEVTFAGKKISGQVKLMQLCKDRTNVTITTRPS